MRARSGLSIFFLALTRCGARSEIAGASPTKDASVEDVVVESCTMGLFSVMRTGPQPDTIALDGPWVYWHDANGIFRVDKNGGVPQTLASPAPQFWPDLAAFAVGGGNLFYASADSIMSQGTVIGHVGSPGFASSSSRVFAWSRDAIPAPFIAYAFDGTVESSGTFPRKPVEMTFVGPGAPCVAEDPGIECDGVLFSGLAASDLVATTTDVWFTSNDSTNGARVMHVEIPSAKTAPIADTTGAFAIAQDDSNLYFTDGAGLRVRRIEGKTGPVADIASNPAFTPIDIVVDDTCVYWTSSSRFDKTGTGWVMAAPKK